MTKKDYKMIALALAKVGAKSQKHGEVVADSVANLAGVFLQDNPRFDKEKFYEFYRMNMYEIRSLASIANH